MSAQCAVLVYCTVGVAQLPRARPIPEPSQWQCASYGGAPRLGRAQQGAVGDAHSHELLVSRATPGRHPRRRTRCPALESAIARSLILSRR